MDDFDFLISYIHRSVVTSLQIITYEVYSDKKTYIERKILTN